MLKKLSITLLASLSGLSIAADSIQLYQAPLSKLNEFPIISANAQNQRSKSVSISANGLISVNKTHQKNKTITRYQQLYQGIPVIGSQVMVVSSSKAGLNGSSAAVVNGQLLHDIQLDVTPGFAAAEAIRRVKNQLPSELQTAAMSNEQAQLQIRPGADGNLTLVYYVSLRINVADEKPRLPVYIMDAHTGQILKNWDNLKSYMDSGAGGNEKVHEYWYGKDGLPGLDVMQVNGRCVMDSGKVSVVHLGMMWDWMGQIVTPYEYECGKNQEDLINGAFSPLNDAYYFGHAIINVYQQWYGLNALQHEDGSPMSLMMRVHFGMSYDNAFWDGLMMSFGDGNRFYPLVSLEVAGHEVSHGFTEQHSGLEYHDESGALNESFSDMAGQTARAWLLAEEPTLYARAYLDAKEVNWAFAETIVKEPGHGALRYMDQPSEDGVSADCLDKELATKAGELCKISYPELVEFATQNIKDEDQRQSFIVHTASGVFNKAFYLLSEKIGIRQAFKLILEANINYWTPTSNFVDAACGVVHSAKDLGVDTAMVKAVFEQVGVDTNACLIED